MSYNVNNVYGLDLETDHNGLDEAWIVQGALSDGSHERTFRDLAGCRDLFLLFLDSQQTSYFYVHNLSYDWEFFKYAVWNLMEKGLATLKLNRRKGKVITATLKATEGKGVIQFRDSQAKMPGPLYSLAKNVGMEKLDGFDFFPGWSETVDLDDPENWRYVCMDARIVAVAMRALHREGYTKSTSSGDCWMDAKRMIRAEKGKTYWERTFPSLSLQLDTALRKAYRGGINISQHRGVLKDMAITHEDVNSMYPTVMMYDALPYGVPIVTECPPENDSTLYVVKCRIKLTLRDGKLPWFTFGNHLDADIENIGPTDPVERCDHFHDMTLTNVDLSLLNEFYEIEVDDSIPPLYWCWPSSFGIFRSYIEKWTKVKKESKGKDPLMYVKAKLMMNGLYGRFALNPDGERCELAYDPAEDDLVYMSSPDVTEDMDAYLPYAIFITAWSRARLLTQVLACGCHSIIHCDTDSVIHMGPPLGDGDYGKDLGQWDIEERPVAIFEGGFKRYIEVLNEPIQHEKDLSVACAGVPQRVDHTRDGVPIGMWVELLDDPQLITTQHELGQREYTIKSEWLRKRYMDNGMDPDSVNTMKLIPKRVRGGVILEERTHRLCDNMVSRFRCRL